MSFSGVESKDALFHGQQKNSKRLWIYVGGSDLFTLAFEEIDEEQGVGLAAMDAAYSSSSQVVLEQESCAGRFKRFNGALSEFVYNSCYCEENVYMLCKKLSEVGLAAPTASDLFVVFVSNPNRQIPIWYQRSSKDVDGLCIWDYHVICIQRRENAVQVWDLDTALPCPVALEEYVACAFRPWLSLQPEFSRLYRVISAPLYLRFFASDRRHMKNKDGSWMANPPVYDCLVAEGQG